MTYIDSSCSVDHIINEFIINILNDIKILVKATVNKLNLQCTLLVIFKKISVLIFLIFLPYLASAREKDILSERKIQIKKKTLQISQNRKRKKKSGLKQNNLMEE